VEAAALLSGEAGPDGPRAALQPGALRSQVRAALTQLLDEHTSLGPCRLTRTKYKPGRRLTASFDVAITGHRQRPANATWRPTGAWPADPPGVADTEEEARRRGLAAPFNSLSARFPEWDMRVDVWPLDAAFPGLVRLSDPTYAATVAALAVPPTVHTLRYRPGERHVLRYDLPTGDDGGVVVKLYRDDRGAEVFRVATAVAHHLEGRGRWRAAAPAAYLSDDQAVLVPVAPGVALSTALRQQRPNVASHLRDAGALLRAVHDAPARLTASVGERHVADELAATERATTAARQLIAGADAAVTAVIDGTRRLLDRLPDEAPAFTHGDFKADNLIAARAGLTVVDFDRCTAADPALDIAKFLADLRWWIADSPAAVDAAREEFLAGYAVTDMRARLARTRALEPLLIVKHAGRRIPVHEPKWAARFSASLADAQALLEGLTGG